MKPRIAMLLLAGATATLLSGCAEELTPEDAVRAWIVEMQKDFKGRVTPLPVVKPYEPVVFAGGTGKPDPFSPSRLAQDSRCEAANFARHCSGTAPTTRRSR